MRHDERNPLGISGTVQSTTGSFITKVIAIIVGGALLVSALVISIAFFAVAFLVAAVGFGYFWWKTRAIRRQVREHLQAQARQTDEVAPPADVIEGVVVSRTERSEHGPTTNQLPVDDKPGSRR